MSTLLFYIVVGKVSIYLIQKFPLVNYLSSKSKLLEELFGCPLCLGVWVYVFLSWFFKINFMQEFMYVPILCELLTGGITSFIVWVFSEGWTSKFRIYEVN